MTAPGFSRLTGEFRRRGRGAGGRFQERTLGGVMMQEPRDVAPQCVVAAALRRDEGLASVGVSDLDGIEKDRLRRDWFAVHTATPAGVHLLLGQCDE